MSVINTSFSEVYSRQRTTSQLFNKLARFPFKRHNCYCQRICLGLPGGKKPSIKLHKHVYSTKCNALFQSKALIYMSYMAW